MAAAFRLQASNSISRRPNDRGANADRVSNNRRTRHSRNANNRRGGREHRWRSAVRARTMRKRRLLPAYGGIPHGHRARPRRARGERVARPKRLQQSRRRMKNSDKSRCRGPAAREQAIHTFSGIAIFRHFHRFGQVLPAAVSAQFILKKIGFTAPAFSDTTFAHQRPSPIDIRFFKINQIAENFKYCFEYSVISRKNTKSFIKPGKLDILKTNFPANSLD